MQVPLVRNGRQLALRRLKKSLFGYTSGISQILHAVTLTSLFQSNRSQAVRLPKDVAFPPNVREVAILRDGPRRIIVPADSLWDDFFDSPGIDLGERDQRPARIRESF